MFEEKIDKEYGVGEIIIPHYLTDPHEEDYVESHPIIVEGRSFKMDLYPEGSDPSITVDKKIGVFISTVQLPIMDLDPSQLVTIKFELIHSKYPSMNYMVVKTGLFD